MQKSILFLLQTADSLRCDVGCGKPFTKEWITFAQSLTSKPVKGMLTGPVTIMNWSFVREYIERKEIAFQLALVLKEEVMALEKAGIKIIQIDEAAVREKLPLGKADRQSKYLVWAIDSFNDIISEVRPETQIHTHMCYSEFSDIIGAIKQMDVDVISIGASRSDPAILKAIKESRSHRGTGPGVYDIHSHLVPDSGTIVGRLNEEVIPALSNMVKAAKTVRKGVKSNKNDSS